MSDEGIVKICDFGSTEKAKEFLTSVKDFRLGLWTEGYTAPEVPVVDVEARKHYEIGDIVMDDVTVGSEEYAAIVKKRDIYALGISIRIMSSGKKCGKTWGQQACHGQWC